MYTIIYIISNLPIHLHFSHQRAAGLDESNCSMQLEIQCFPSLAAGTMHIDTGVMEGRQALERGRCLKMRYLQSQARVPGSLCERTAN